jgi:hypothetical protein
MEVFIQRDGQQYGPYTVAEVNDFLETGDLMPDDLAWFDGAPDWLPLAALAEGAGPAPGYEWDDDMEPGSDAEYATAAETDPHVIYVPFSEAESEGPSSADAETHSAPETADASVCEESASEGEAGHEDEPEPVEEAEDAPSAENERPQTQTGLVPGPLVTPPLVAVKSTVRTQEPPWVPPRRDASGPLPHPSNMKRSALAAFAGTPFDTPPHVTASNEPVISEQEAHQMAKKFASQGAVIDPERSVAVRKVLIGGLLFIAGIGVTIISYQESASKSGAGGLTYVVAWAAIAFGGLLFIRGLLQIFGD